MASLPEWQARQQEPAAAWEQAHPTNPQLRA